MSYPPKGYIYDDNTGYYINKNNLWYDPIKKKIINPYTNKPVPEQYKKTYVGNGFYQNISNNGFYYHVHTGYIIDLWNVIDIKNIQYDEENGFIIGKKNKVEHIGNQLVMADGQNKINIVPNGWDNSKYKKNNTDLVYNPYDGFVRNKHGKGYTIYYFNSLLDVFVNIKTQKNYNNVVENIRNSKLPYQTYDMKSKKSNPIRFTAKENILQYINNRNELFKLRGHNGTIITGGKIKCLVDQPSIVDIHKVNNNKYLQQVDKTIIGHNKRVNKIIQNTWSNDDITSMFIPFIEEIKEDNGWTYDEKYNVHVFNDELFVKNIKKDYGVDANNILYQLKILFMKNNIFNTTEVFEKNILEIEKNRLYGMKKEKVRETFLKMKNKLEILKKNKLNVNCAQLKKPNYDDAMTLAEIDISKYEKTRETCEYIKMGLDKLLDSLDKSGIDDEKNDVLKICASEDFMFSPEDSVDTATNITCNKLINIVQDDDLKNKMKEINEEHESVFTDEQLGIDPENISFDKYEFDDFTYLYQYTPEWYNAMLSNNKKDAFKYRQSVFGDYKITYNLQRCSLFSRSGTFVSHLIPILDVSWNININKSVLECIMNKDMIFPLRIIMNNQKINMYSSYNTLDQNFIGTIVTKSSGKRFDNAFKYYNTYIYYDKVNKIINTCNFRLNTLYAGTFFEHIKILYLELNSLMYYKYDLGNDIYFYRHSNGNNYFVSKYTIEQIKNKYKQFDDRNLVEYILKKDENKQIYFKQKIQSGGGNASIKKSPFFKKITLKNKINYEWDVIYKHYNVNFDDIFPTKLYYTYLDLLDYVIDIVGLKFFNLYYLITSSQYLTFVRPEKTRKIHDSHINKLYNQQVIIINKYIYKHKKQNNNHTRIISYSFSEILSIEFLKVLFSLNIQQSSNILLIAKNNIFMDTLHYYKQYVKPINFHVFLYNTFEIQTAAAKDYAKDKKIPTTIINNPLTDPITITKLQNKINKNKQDLIILDLNLTVKHLSHIRTNYNFQTLIPQFIIALNNLKKGGNLILYIWNVTNKLVFNFLLYISTFFHDFIIYDSIIPYYSPQFNMYVFKHFKNNFKDNEKLLKLNKQNFIYDPTGGMNYKVTSLEDNRSDQYYLYNVFNIDNADDLYKKYHNYIEQIYNNKITLLNNIYLLNKNIKNKKYIADLLEKNLVQAINYANDVGIDIVEWIDPKSAKKQFYINSVKNLYKNISTQLYQIGPYNDTITENNKQLEHNEEIKMIKILHENAYKYIETENQHTLKTIEQTINANQKRLQKFLFKKYNININGQYVNRAWLKIFELFSVTNFFNNIKEKPNVFYICEAPGNFIASTQYYIKCCTKHKSFNWTAQSLYDGDIYDHYNFIKDNPDKWDFGADLSGDITKYINLKYYYEKYKGVDIVIGDCGLKWGSNVNLGKYQLFYDMLLLKKGGNFILKSYAPNTNQQYLSLLYMATTKFKKVFVFKSSRNFWSPEIYIVGIGFTGLTKEETQLLFKMFENDNIYPVREIPKDFYKKYTKILNTVVDNYANIKKFFVYLARYPKKLKQFKLNLSLMVDERNKKWLDKYMTHLDDVKKQYSNFYKSK